MNIITAAFFFGLLYFGAMIFGIRFSGSRIANEDDAQEVIPQEYLTGDTISTRKKLEPIIDRWAQSTYRSKTRKHRIYKWHYAKGNNPEKICVYFTGTAVGTVGTLNFLYDHDYPRVSSFTWEENGQKCTMRGESLPQLSKQTLYRGYVMELNNDAEKIRYVNEIAERAMRKGQAEFDICKYERITKKQFQQLYGLREIRALCKAVADSANVNLDYSRETGKAIMTPANEPK